MKDICVIERLEDWDKNPVCSMETYLFAEVNNQWQRVKYIGNMKFSNTVKYRFKCKLYEDEFDDKSMDNRHRNEFKFSKNMTTYKSIFKPFERIKLRLCFEDDRNLTTEDNKRIYKEINEFVFYPEKVDQYYDEDEMVWMENVFGSIFDLKEITNETL